MLSKNIANYKINIDIKSNQIKQNIFEIYTSLSLKPTKNDFEKIIFSLNLITIFNLSLDIEGISSANFGINLPFSFSSYKVSPNELINCNDFKVLALAGSIDSIFPELAIVILFESLFFLQED